MADIKIKFNELFKVAVLGDFVFAFSGILKLIILVFFKSVNTLDDIQIQPLSLSNLFDKRSLDVFYLYPLSVINVFEVIYILVLVFFISDLVGQTFISTLKKIATSYGTGLLIWVLFVMFMNMSFT